MEVRSASLAAFRHLLAHVDPNWTSRPSEEQEHWVHWFDRTARAISRQYARSFRDPSHDDADVLQNLSKSELVGIFDYGYFLGHVDEIYDRVGL